MPTNHLPSLRNLENKDLAVRCANFYQQLCLLLVHISIHESFRFGNEIASVVLTLRPRVRLRYRHQGVSTSLNVVIWPKGRPKFQSELLIFLFYSHPHLYFDAKA
ncbi:hypothetical protein CDAR_56821 [Caerostris darwini]|uniref:Uncharacterized protein n=1 Tax=Caerostris darwini TaxID=1538125 RepID=A0AAV4UMQ9_9ARAC|nr:hypothetical protein CDAR_56821 [Caerostris darwini]